MKQILRDLVVSLVCGAVCLTIIGVGVLISMIPVILFL